jgi:hypothetical protein
MCANLIISIFTIIFLGLHQVPTEPALIKDVQPICKPIFFKAPVCLPYKATGNLQPYFVRGNSIPYYVRGNSKHYGVRGNLKRWSPKPNYVQVYKIPASIQQELSQEFIKFAYCIVFYIVLLLHFIHAIELLNYKAESKSCPKFISKKHGNKAR